LANRRRRNNVRQNGSRRIDVTPCQPFCPLLVSHERVYLKMHERDDVSVSMRLTAGSVTNVSSEMFMLENRTSTLSFSFKNNLEKNPTSQSKKKFG